MSRIWKVFELAPAFPSRHVGRWYLFNWFWLFFKKEKYPLNFLSVSVTHSPASTYISVLMQNSINHLLAKYTVTDVTPKIWKSLGRKILTHWQRENTVPESSPLLKVMFYENLICEVEELFNVSMTQWHAQVFFLLEPRWDLIRDL